MTSETDCFQFGMRTAIHSAAGAINQLPALFEGMGAKRVLILSDQGLKSAGIVERVTQVFGLDEKVSKPAIAGIYAEISPDAEIGSIHAAAKLAGETDADAILALGGGSVLDAAKGVKYCLRYDIQDLTEILREGVKMDVWPEVKSFGIPHIAVPTTAGTGAEVTPFAVIYNADTHVKALLGSPYLEADMAVLDAELTVGLPKSITIATAMDALTHALESIASPAANHFTDAHAIRAAQIIQETLLAVVREPDDLVARASLLQASTMACNAVANALNVNMVHNCSHALGAIYRIPHGEANGVLLPIVLDEMRDFYVANGRRLAFAMNCQNAHELSEEDALDKAIEAIRGLQEDVDFDSAFTRFDIQESDLDLIVKSVASDPLAIFHAMPGEKVRAIVQCAAGW